MIALPHVAERLFGRVHAIEPVALQAIVEGPAGRRILAGEPIEKSKRKARDFRAERLAALADAETVSTADGLVQYALTPDGVAVIPVAGVLTQKFDWLAAACGWTTYDGLRATIAAALADQRVSGILLDVDSPGGEAAGMPDIGDAIMAAGREKPIWAIANPLAASAAYAIAGSASRLVLPRLARVGSIGCVVIHVDQSKADAASGLKYTAVYSGARKIDGWGHAPLSEEAQAAAQADVDHVRDVFSALVGRQGRLSAAGARATEAAIFADAAAVEAGLADEVMTFDAALVALAKHASVKVNPKGEVMSEAELLLSAAQVPTPAAAAHTHAAMSAPGPGEKCELCGQTMPDEEARPGEEEKVEGRVPAPALYSVEDAQETAKLCQIAGAPQLCAAFVTAKTPIAEVRAALAKRAADATDGDPVDPTPPAGTREQEVAAQWDEIVAKHNASIPKAPVIRL